MLTDFVDLCYDWVMELSRILKINVDYSEDTHNETLVRNTTVQLTLSIQNSLGFQGEFKSRSFAGKLAWVILQLRNIVVLVTVASNVKRSEGGNSEPVSPLDDPGKLHLKPFPLKANTLYRDSQRAEWLCPLGA